VPNFPFSNSPAARARLSPLSSIAESHRSRPCGSSPQEPGHREVVVPERHLASSADFDFHGIDPRFAGGIPRRGGGGFGQRRRWMVARRRCGRSGSRVRPWRSIRPPAINKTAAAPAAAAIHFFRSSSMSGARYQAATIRASDIRPRERVLPGAQKKSGPWARSLRHVPLRVITCPSAHATMPPPGAPCACSSSFGDSAIMTSVVSSKPATEAAFCRARRVTLVGPECRVQSCRRTRWSGVVTERALALADPVQHHRSILARIGGRSDAAALRSSGPGS